VLLINRYDCILNHENRPELVGARPVLKDVQYERKMRWWLLFFVLYKVAMFCALLAITVVAMVLSYQLDGFSDILSLHGMKCGTAMRYAPDFEEAQRCHWKHEVLFYGLSICTQVLAITILVLWLVSTGFLVVYGFLFRRFIIKPETVDYEMTDWMISPVDTKRPPSEEHQELKH
jgi:hypothetical protein